HAERVARAFRRFVWYVSQNIKLTLLAPDALQTTQKIVGVEDGKSASAFGQRRQDLLIGGRRRWKRRNDGARLIVRRIEIEGIRVAASPSGPRCSSGASCVSCATRSAPGASLSTCACGASSSPGPGASCSAGATTSSARATCTT